MGPMPGYWRRNNLTDRFTKCYNQDACLGSENASSDPRGKCAVGYRGVMCADCSPNYAKNGYYECGDCPSNTMNIVRVSFVFIATLIAVSTLIA